MIDATNLTAAQNHAVGVGLNGEDLTKYDADVNMNNIWESDTVYNEAVLFANTSDGIVETSKTLLYPIDDVISIRNDNLDIWYVKGVDYKVENGKLVWLPDGKMPNYTHSKTWEEFDGSEGYTPKAPKNQYKDMKPFYNKLATTDDINVLVYGDSTATGLSSTGANVNYDLFGADNSVSLRSSGRGIKAPTFFEQAAAKLVKDFGNGNNINYYNIALGGMSSAWGKDNLSARVDAMNSYYDTTIIPDIIYVKFAANDARISSATYKANMQSIVSQFKELYPNAVIVLVSGKINNERCTIFGDHHDNFVEHEKGLAEIAEATENCIVAENTSVWVEIVKSKSYVDYLSNNINHANDFWGMVTAQVIVAAAKKIPTPAAPAAPTLADKTTTTVTLTAVDGYEYSKDGKTWQTSAKFTGLSAGTTYKFYQRIAESDFENASPASAALSVTTDKANQTAPAKPTLSSKTTTTVTLKAVTGYEYSKNGTT